MNLNPGANPNVTFDLKATLDLALKFGVISKEYYDEVHSIIKRADKEVDDLKELLIKTMGKIESVNTFKLWYVNFNREKIELFRKKVLDKITQNMALSESERGFADFSRINIPKEVKDLTGKEVPEDTGTLMPNEKPVLRLKATNNKLPIGKKKKEDLN